MAPPIVVINPNSTVAVTEGLRRALEPLRFADGPDIECATLAEGPPAIETEAHIEAVIEPLSRYVREHEQRARAFVLACYSDPGLERLREQTARPVLGIGECGMLTALALGRRFGVVSILEPAVRRHLDYVRRLGLEARLAGDRALGLGVLELADETRTRARLESVGRTLRDEDGADVLVLGCAGMARYRGELEETLGVPVVDPTQAAVAMALGGVMGDW